MPMKRKAFTFWLLGLSVVFLSCGDQKPDNSVLTMADGATYSKHFGIMLFNDFEKGLACSRKLNRPIFLMFTGYLASDLSFINKVAPDPKVKEFLSHHFVPIILFVDDKAKLPDDKVDSVVIGDKIMQIETVGNLNMSIQIVEFQKVSQPYYLLLDPIGKNLVEPWAYEPNPEVFVEHFTRGLSKWRESQTKE